MSCDVVCVAGWEVAEGGVAGGGSKFSLNKMWLCLGLGFIISSQDKDELI